MRKETGQSILAFLLSLAVSTCTIGQNMSGPDARTSATARHDLLRWFEMEKTRGASIFYSQSYKAHGRRIQFHGSILGEIQNAEVDGCTLNIKSRIVDLYTGSIGGLSAGSDQSTYVSSTRFELTPNILASLKVVSARPVRQLSVGTHAVCSGVAQCSLTWVKLGTNAKSIHLTEFTNEYADYKTEVKDFDGFVSQFYLPVSSADSGVELIARLKEYAQTCGQ